MDHSEQDVDVEDVKECLKEELAWYWITMKFLEVILVVESFKVQIWNENYQNTKKKFT